MQYVDIYDNLLCDLMFSFLCFFPMTDVEGSIVHSFVLMHTNDGNAL